ncbi:MAG: hypothetical protein HRU41_37770 [Saprospiraceae bacterium]|nr:hypothetical protein [Saprospiraceae bacterium]
MEINYSLLDQLKQYFQGELDPETAQTITKKLEEDPIYQAHAYVYKLSQEGIGAHQRQQKLDVIKDIPAAINVEAIWQQDHQLTKKKRLITGLLAVLMVAIASALVLRQFSGEPEKQVPIADQMEESEPLFGAEGQERRVSLVPLNWDSTDQLIPIEQEEKIILLHPAGTEQISFSRRGDTLHLYTPRVDYDPIQWISRSTASPSLILRLGDQLFGVPEKESEGTLKVSTYLLEDLPK